MNTISHSLRNSAGLICVFAALSLPASRVAAQDASSGGADAFPTFDSYIKLSGQAASMSGDKAAYAARADTPTTGSVGIEDMLYEKDLAGGSSLVFKGHALDGSDDYLADLNLSNDKVGSIDAGYKRFRTFYDGVGGFFPLADQFEVNSPENLHVDRSSFWVNARFSRTDNFALTIGFHDEIRTGDKDSTIWAPVINPNAVVTAGALVGNALPANTPYINPNVLSLAEHHNILDASMTAKLESTTETLKASMDWVGNLDTRYYTKYPNPMGVIADPTVNVLDDQEAIKTKSFRIINETETPINALMSVDTGLSYLHVVGNDGGLWITPAYSTTLKTVYNADTAANIYANASSDDYVGNIFLKLTPAKEFLAEIGFREEFNTVGDAGGFDTTSLASTATTIAPSSFTTAYDPTYSHYDDHVATPDISLSYRGIQNLSLYASFDKRIDRGQQHWVNPYTAVSTAGVTGLVTTTPASLSSVFFQEANQDYENAKIGADWTASSMLTVRAELFRKDHQNTFIGSNDVIGTAGNGALFDTGYTFTGVNLTVIAKPMAVLAFTTRYQPQYGNMSVLGNTANGGNGTEITSGKARAQMISEMVDWTPIKQFYAQGNLSVVYNYIQTAYPVVPVSTTSYIPTPIQNSNDNYVTGSALFGFVLDKATDAQIQGVWQQATNYNPQIADGGQPFGAGFLYESATVGVKRKLSDKLILDAKVGYLKATDATTGSFTNYKGPLAYVSVEYGL